MAQIIKDVVTWLTDWFPLRTELSEVATSGSYTDLLDKPQSIAPATHFHTISDITDYPTYSTVAITGSYNDLLNKPTLFSGSYNDLTNKPTIPLANTTASNIQMDGTRSAGTGISYARANHVHPSDTSKEDVSNKETSWSSDYTGDTDSYPTSQLVKSTFDQYKFEYRDKSKDLVFTTAPNTTYFYWNDAGHRNEYGLGGDTDYYIDWGDGNAYVCSDISKEYEHEYSVSGQYTITVSPINSPITKLGSNLFYNYYQESERAITSIQLPSTLINIEDECFKGQRLDDVDIIFPESLAYIGYDAFNGVEVRNVIFKGSVPPTIENDGLAFFDNGDYQDCYVPNSSWSQYLDALYYFYPSIYGYVVVDDRIVVLSTNATGDYPLSNNVLKQNYVQKSSTTGLLKNDGSVMSSGTGASNYAVGNHTHTISNITDYPLFCEVTGGVSTTTYVNILKITVTESGMNRPITLAVQKKGSNLPTYVSIRLSNTDITQEDYTIDNFIIWGDKSSYFLRQSASNEFVLIAYKGSGNSLKIINLYNGQSGVTITALDTNFGTTKPSNTANNPVWTATYTISGVEIVDDLITDDANKVLSAKQGKALNSMIGDIQDIING